MGSPIWAENILDLFNDFYWNFIWCTIEFPKATLKHSKTLGQANIFCCPFLSDHNIIDTPKFDIDVPKLFWRFNLKSNFPSYEIYLMSFCRCPSKQCFEGREILQSKCAVFEICPTTLRCVLPGGCWSGCLVYLLALGLDGGHQLPVLPGDAHGEGGEEHDDDGEHHEEAAIRRLRRRGVGWWWRWWTWVGR